MYQEEERIPLLGLWNNFCVANVPAVSVGYDESLILSGFWVTVAAFLCRIDFLHRDFDKTTEKWRQQTNGDNRRMVKRAVQAIMQLNPDQKRTGCPGYLGALLLMAALLSGCGQQSPPPSQATLPSATAVTAQTPVAAPAATDTPVSAVVATNTPAPADETGNAGGQVMPDTGAAVVERLDVRILESFPVQVHVVLTGYLPDGCTTINATEAVQEGTTFRIRLTTTRPADAICTQAITPFEETVALDVAGLAAGTYQVAANDLAVGFDLPASGGAEQPQSGVYPVVETPVEYVLAENDVTIYNAPLPDSAEIGFVGGGQSAKVTGASPDGAWWRVICPDDTVGDCWVSADPAVTVPAAP